jgi:glutathione S-transferase
MAITLFYSPFHTFVHKVLVTAHECGHWDDLVRVPTFPFYNNDGEYVRGQYSLAALNPLDKVPTLVSPTGQVIYGSQAVCEYLDATSKARRMYPDAGPARWDAVTRLALCDTLFELTVQMVMEQWNPPETQRIGLFEWIWPKIFAGLDSLEAGAQRGWTDFDVGHASMLHMISYISFRAEFYPAKDPLYPGYNWREGRPALTAWYNEALTRPSVTSHYNLPYEGDKSAAYHQDMVARMVALGQAHQS